MAKYKKDWDMKYPAISDLRVRASNRIPHFAFEYLDSGTGEETGMHRSNQAFTKLTMMPKFMKGKLNPVIDTELFGRDYNAPLGVPPIGYSSLMWPGSEQILARAAATHKIAHCLSTAASDTPENCGPTADGYGWFQLYPPRETKIRRDLLKRAKDSGYSVLVVTADVPAPSMRERQRRSGISIPPKLTPPILYSIAKRPHWALATLMRGKPTFSIMEKYMADRADGAFKHIVNFVATELGGTLDWEYLKTLREEWDGPLVLKGILDVEDAKEAVKCGVDGVWVSNHGGRQFESAPASLDALPDIAGAVGKKTKIIFDSGVRCGTDILKAIALGADFVFAGRAFMYGVSALGKDGADHVYNVLTEDMINNMHQLGIERLEQLRDVEIQQVNYQPVPR